MKTSRRQQSILSRTRFLTVLIIATLAIGLATITAYMKQPGKTQPEPAGFGKGLVSAKGAPATRPLAAGTCNDVLPALSNVEVEATNSANNLGYSTLGAAFAAINLGTHTGTITIDICNNTTELASAVLNASGGTSAYSQITISPVGTWTISGAVAGPLVDLNGADNVTIDGVTASALTFSNTDTGATTSTIRFINDASNNAVKNCTIRGSSTGVATGTIFFSTGTTTGNDGNTIRTNDITSAGANLPTNGIFSSGTSAAIDNSGNVVQLNNISDYFNATVVSSGINLSATGNSAWSITNNKLFQTATRVYTTGNTHNGIFIGTGAGYIISSNTIGGANSAGTGTTNMIGNSVDLPGFPASYTPAGASTLTGYRGINATFTAAGAVSDIQNNTIAGHALYTSANGSAFIAILVGAGNANIGDTAKNIIGAESGAGGVGTPASIYSATTGTGGSVVGILAATANTVVVQNNTIGNIDSVGTSATIAGGFLGINTQGAGGTATTSSNIIGNTTAANIRIGYTTTTGVAGGNLSNAGILTSTTTATTGSLSGITSQATGPTLNITTNIIRNLISSVSHTGAVSSFLGIINQGAVTTTINITNNQLGTATAPAATYTGTANQVNGIISSGGTATTTTNLNNNTLQGFVLAASGQVTGVSNQSAAVGVAINIKDNQIGTATQDAYTYSAASAGAIIGVFNSNGAATALLTVTGNDIRRIVQTVAGTGQHIYFLNQTFTGSTNISNNTFTNITANTTGSITFISNSVTHAAGTTHNVNNNAVVTAYNKTAAGGNVRFYNAFGSSGATVTETNNLNNFSNITFTGATTSDGWRSADGTTPGSRKTVTNNTFNNITGGTGVISSILYVGFSDNTFAGNNVSGNTITNVTNGNSITGIFSDGQNQNFFGNTISSLSATGTGAVVNGIQIAGATTQNIFKNKICTLQSDNATGTVNGILITAGTTNNVFNNLIGDLKAPNTNSTTDAVRGISLTSTAATSNLNVYYNTVRLSASSTGTDFGTSGIFHAASATATTATLDLRDNIIDNLSIPAGAGRTVAFHRSAAALDNYASTSNNNDFYAGAPGVAHLIYDDSAAGQDQTLAAYKIRVAARDSASVSLNPPFLSTTCGTATFLHINPAFATAIESGGANVAGITDDVDNQIRQGNGGYVGTGTAPDIGADEFAGATPPTAAPATISGQVTTTTGGAPMAGVTMFLSGSRSGGRAVTDASGIYRFSNVATEDFYTLTPSRVNYQFSPASRSFSLLGNVTDAAFTGSLDAVISGNVIDSPEYFVRQHYLDFLGREPDYAGLNFWSDQMRGCGNDFNCLERRTINVSAAYFLSIEFQETGGLVDGLYRASYGRAPLFAEFMPDRATIAHDVIVGESGWDNTLRANKQAFLDAWVQRADFRAAYDNLTNDGYVDALVSHTRVNFTDSERAVLVGGLADGTLSRAGVLQRVAENERFVAAKFNEAFVRMQYFGYLRRDPDDSGFHFWLNKLNEFDGNFERAEMVKAFLVSGEYRDRFRQQ